MNMKTPAEYATRAELLSFRFVRNAVVLLRLTNKCLFQKVKGSLKNRTPPVRVVVVFRCYLKGLSDKDGKVKCYQ